MQRRIESYEQALEFLYSRVNFERQSSAQYGLGDFLLDRMRQLLQRLGNPQEQLPTVHIAGTKGKGSTAAMLASVLTASGHRTGLFTSPHITQFEERFTVDGRQPSPDELVDLVNQVAEVVQAMDELPGAMSPTYFEIVTALGWLYFIRQRAQIVVLEVGLGGRLDSTNICRPNGLSRSPLKREGSSRPGCLWSQACSIRRPER
jgi:dihydrofolate synthase/folylpolyglutamate synthase